MRERQAWRKKVFWGNSPAAMERRLDAVGKVPLSPRLRAMMGDGE